MNTMIQFMVFVTHIHAESFFDFALKFGLISSNSHSSVVSSVDVILLCHSMKTSDCDKDALPKCCTHSMNIFIR